MMQKPVRPILLLGYEPREWKIHSELKSRGLPYDHAVDGVSCFKDFSLVISYGYKHILTKKVLESAVRPVLNLHISFLPYNRGAHPNFWSFYDKTVKGVSIHEVDSGIDTGHIVYQKEVVFKKEEDTFAKTYFRLRSEIEALFINNLDAILNQHYQPKKQSHSGTYHRKADLPAKLFDWSDTIGPVIEQIKTSL